MMNETDIPKSAIERAADLHTGHIVVESHDEIQVTPELRVLEVAGKAMTLMAIEM